MMNNGWVFVRPEAVDTICAPAFALAYMLPVQLMERGLIRHETVNHDWEICFQSLPMPSNEINYDYPQDMIGEKQGCL